MSARTNRIEILARWTYDKPSKSVGLVPRHPNQVRGMGPDTVYSLVYPFQNDLGLNDRPTTRLKITIEVLPDPKKKRGGAR